MLDQLRTLEEIHAFSAVMAEAFYQKFFPQSGSLGDKYKERFPHEYERAERSLRLSVRREFEAIYGSDGANPVVNFAREHGLAEVPGPILESQSAAVIRQLVPAEVSFQSRIAKKKERDKIRLCCDNFLLAGWLTKPFWVMTFEEMADAFASPTVTEDGFRKAVLRLKLVRLPLAKIRQLQAERCP